MMQHTSHTLETNGSPELTVETSDNGLSFTWHADGYMEDQFTGLNWEAARWLSERLTEALTIKWASDKVSRSGRDGQA